jgi:hypothetical protein
MTQLLDEATIAPMTDAPSPTADNDGADARSVEKLLLGSVAVFMVVWVSLLGWLAWWFIA